MMFFSMNDVYVSRGPIGILKGVNIKVEREQLVSLIGANGAGKTTTLLTIVGLLKPLSGSIEFLGDNVTGEKPDAILKQGIALCPAERHIFPRMTVLENLMLGAFIRSSKAEIETDLEKVFEYFPRLQERMYQIAGTLSGGEQQMLAMARSVMGKPRLLLLDEPSLGLAPIMVQELGRLIQQLNRDGTTIMLVEQNALLALGISEYTYVMELGQIVMEGPSADLVQQDGVRRAFLGE